MSSPPKVPQRPPSRKGTAEAIRLSAALLTVNTPALPPRPAFPRGRSTSQAAPSGPAELRQPPQASSEEATPANRLSSRSSQYIPAEAFLPLSPAVQRAAVVATPLSASVSATSLDSVSSNSGSEDSLSGSDYDENEQSCASLQSKVCIDSAHTTRTSARNSPERRGRSPNRERASVPDKHTTELSAGSVKEDAVLAIRRRKTTVDAETEHNEDVGQVCLKVSDCLAQGDHEIPQLHTVAADGADTPLLIDVPPRRPLVRPRSDSVVYTRVQRRLQLQADGLSPEMLDEPLTSDATTPETATLHSAIRTIGDREKPTQPVLRTTVSDQALQTQDDPQIENQHRTQKTPQQPHPELPKLDLQNQTTPIVLETAPTPSPTAGTQKYKYLAGQGVSADLQAGFVRFDAIMEHQKSQNKSHHRKKALAPTRPQTLSLPVQGGARRRAHSVGDPCGVLQPHVFKQKTALAKVCVVCGTLTVRKGLKCTVCRKYIHNKCRNESMGCWGVGGKAPPFTGRHHAFVMTTFVQPTYCLVCFKLCRGLVDQGERCVECPYPVHRHCRLQAPASCTLFSSLTSVKAKGSIGKELRAQGYTAHHPIVLIPGLCSSGLVVTKSDIKPAWEGSRLWLSLNKLGGSSLFKFNNVKGISDTQTLAEAAATQKNEWIRHLCLDEGLYDPKGIKVRPMNGIDAVDFLEPGALTGAASYVFSTIIEELRFVGYNSSNLHAAPYDWRLPPAELEKRDGYFSSLVAAIEQLYQTNNNIPVVLFGHSMGSACANYFLNFARQQMGQGWLDVHIHTYVAAGGPWLGALKAIRSAVVGEDFGLPFINTSEALLMCRSMGSGAWLLPRGPLLASPIVYVREEGSWVVGPVTASFTTESHVKHTDTVTLIGSYRKHAFKTKSDRSQGAHVWPMRFQVASAHAHQPQPSEIMHFKVLVGRSHIGSVVVNCADFAQNADSQAIEVLSPSASAHANPTTNSESNSGINNETNSGIGGGGGGKDRTAIGFLFIRLEYVPAARPPGEVDVVHNAKTKGKSSQFTYTVRKDWKEFLKESAAHAMVHGWERDYRDDPLLHNWSDPPPVARLVNVYGINLPTEAGYAFRVKTAAINSCLYTKFKLDNAFRNGTHKCVDGVAYENKYTCQQDSHTQVQASGDGTVTYLSLNYPERWISDAYDIDVENIEFEKMEHREMLGDERLIDVLIRKATHLIDPDKSLHISSSLPIK